MYKILIFLVFLLPCCQNHYVEAKKNPVYPISESTDFLTNLEEESEQSGSLFVEKPCIISDTTAYKKGDTLSVIIQERYSITEDSNMNLEKSSETKTTIEPSNLGDITKFLPFIANQISNLKGARETSHTGKAKYQNKSNISDRLTVIVTEVRTDGLLVVWGRKSINIAGEKRTLSISGLVNANDIREDNSIFSDNIALSSMQVEGGGSISSTTHPGLGSKTFKWILDLLFPF